MNDSLFANNGFRDRQYIESKGFLKAMNYPGSAIEFGIRGWSLFITLLKPSILGTKTEVLVMDMGI